MSRPRFLADHDLMAPQSSPIASIIDNLVLIWAASELQEWKDQVVFLPFS